MSQLCDQGVSDISKHPSSIHVLFSIYPFGRTLLSLLVTSGMFLTAYFSLQSHTLISLPASFFPLFSCTLNTPARTIFGTCGAQTHETWCFSHYRRLRFQERDQRHRCERQGKREKNPHESLNSLHLALYASAVRRFPPPERSSLSIVQCRSLETFGCGVSFSSFYGAHLYLFSH